jgi:hypothetical protein
VLPSVAEDVAELKYKGAHEGEVTRYKELATRRTELNKKVKGGGATKDDHLEVERVKTKLAGIRQQIRDRYAAEHGREKEKSITGKKVSQGKVKDDVSESGKRDTAKVDKGDTPKVKVSEPVKTTGVERVGGPPAVGTAAANAHLVQHLTTLGGTSGGLVHLGDLHAATGWSRQDFEVAVHGARRAGMVTLSGAEGRHGVTERDKASAIYEKDPVTGRADSMLLYASLRSQGAKHEEPKAAVVKLTEGRPGWKAARTDSHGRTVIEHESGYQIERSPSGHMSVVHKESRDQRYSGHDVVQAIASVEGAGRFGTGTSAAEHTVKAIQSQGQRPPPPSQPAAPSQRSGHSREEVQQMLRGKAFDERRAIIKKIMDDAKSEQVRTHGMPESEAMDTVHVGGIKWQWGATHDRDRIADNIAQLVTSNIPEHMWKANSQVTYTRQRNQEDPKWSREYGIPNFKSIATGGNGSMCIYNGKDVTISTFAHESGHNLAYKVWGAVTPPAGTRYAEAQKREGDVSAYGSVHRAEDFAEVAKFYVTKPQVLRQSHPLKYAAFEAMVR